MEDDVLVKLVQSGDNSAFRKLFIKYYPTLCEYAAMYVGDYDSEDLVQRLMIYIWEERENICVETSIKTYLFKSVKNRCLNSIRDKKTHSKIHTIIREEMGDCLEDPDYYSGIGELSEKINEAISSLPENYRETFELSRFGDTTNKKLAEMLAVSEKTIEYRISQSLKILRVKLKDYLPVGFIFFLLGFDVNILMLL